MDVKLIIVIMLVILLLSACVPGDGKHTSSKRAGFLWGIWHGWIAPISLIIRIFNPNIRIYEVYNTGWWYEFGFYIAIIGGFGTISLTRRKRKKH